MKPTADASQHPDEVVTASYLENRLAAPLRDQVETHLASCDQCRASVLLLRGAMQEGDPAPPEFLQRALDLSSATSNAPSSTLAWRKFLLPIAATVVVAVGLGAWWLSTRDQSPPHELTRSGAAAGFTGLAPAAGASVDAAQLRFEWSAIPAADRYLIEVVAQNGERVAQWEVDRTTLSSAWPSTAPPPTLGRYLWRVQAMALDRRLVDSRPIPFEVR